MTKSCSATDVHDAKFVDSAVSMMVDKMIRRGARKRSIVAKIFGGARMFEPKPGVPGVLQIGDENVHTVRSLLDEVFGPDNCCALITFKKTTGATVSPCPVKPRNT